MIVPDVNLLLYAHITGFPEHRRARRWWAGLKESGHGRELGRYALDLYTQVKSVWMQL